MPMLPRSSLLPGLRRLLCQSCSKSMVTYITNQELAVILEDKDKLPNKDYVVVDVRDGDYFGGNIPNSVHSPSADFLKNVDALVRQTKEVPAVIFTCFLSQSRGPKAARIYQDTRAMQVGDDPQVLVLQGGFSQFQAKYRHDPQLVENWIKDCWD